MTKQIANCRRLSFRLIVRAMSKQRFYDRMSVKYQNKMFNINITALQN